MRELFKCTYGSHLYGTSTPTSDVDDKVIYLPDFNDVLLGKKLQIFKKRVDAEGNHVPDNASMPDNGIETEYVPLQTFCRDFLGGQTYALEVAFAVLQKPSRAPVWLGELVASFLTCNVSSMAGFAMKQTFDYVRRGRRLEKARDLLDVVEYWSATLDDLDNVDPGSYMKRRLDTVLPDGRKVLYEVAKGAGLELGTSVNNNRTMETLKLNGREYLETTDLKQLELAVSKLIGEYGGRSQAAAKVEVDHKSLSHAVRVYEQAVELLTVGKLTFPRSNAGYLLNVKQGNLDLEDVKARLLELEERVTALQRDTNLLKGRTPSLDAYFEKWLLNLLRNMYGIAGK